MSDQPMRAIALPGQDIEAEATAAPASTPEPVAPVEPEPLPEDHLPQVQVAAAASSGGSGSSIATRLVALVRELAEVGDVGLWHAEGTREPYITVKVDEHREHYRLSTRAARDWLARLAHQQLGRAPGGQAISDASTV